MTKEEFQAFVGQALDEYESHMGKEDPRSEFISKIVDQWESDIFNAWKLGEQVTQ